MGKMLHPSPIGMHQMLGYIINGSVLVINNCLIIQWGWRATTNQGTLTVNLPITYTKFYVCIVGKGDNQRGSYNQAWVSAQNLTLASFETTTFDTLKMSYITIGY